MKGRITTWTVLQVPPEGFDAPLNLCVVKTKEGNILAYADDNALKIGRKVNLESQGEFYYARKRKWFF